MRAINAGAHELPRSALDELTEQAKGLGAKGLVWAYVEEGGGWRSPIAKFLSDAEVAALNDAPRRVRRRPAARGGRRRRRRGARARRAAARAGRAAGAGRRPGAHDLLWVVDFPMFAWNADEERWDPLHHPFTAPSGDLDDPGALRSRAYDLVLDGFEIGGGSIRIHDPDVQRRVLELIGIGPEEAQARFGFLLDALRYGAPPHGGIAMGFDRIVALVAGLGTLREVNIREVITFPKTATGADPLTGAPAPVDPRQLSELGLRAIGDEKPGRR